MVYKTPIEDFKYNLEMLKYDSLVSNIDKFKDYDAETLLSIVSEIGRLNEQEALSSNKVGDREGLKYITNGKEGPEVQTPDSYNLLYKIVRD